MNSSLPLQNNNLTLWWYDYLIFAIMLTVSTSVGIYFGCVGNKQRTISEYLLGGKKMTALPIALSVAVGHFTAVTIMVIPADVYRYGVYFWLSCLSMVLLVIVSAYIYFPVFFDLQITSAYEYLEMRFDRRTRLLASFVYIFSEHIYLGVVAYTPSLALSVATGLNVNLISFTICAICVFYTTIGGLKAVVWTDFFQLGIIILSLTTVCVIGTISNGSFVEIWDTALKGSRLDIWDFDLDPTKRDSFWILVIGFTTHFTNFFCLAQSGFQKFRSLPTFKDCVWSLTYAASCMSVIVTLVVFIGLSMYARYAKCDPLASRKIQRYEQMVPYYIMDIAGGIPGVSGCYLVALFCASLSTISSSLNAIAGVVYKDFLYEFLGKETNERKVTRILKLIVALSGVVCIGLVTIMQHMGDIVPLSASVMSMLGGPSTGLFTLGVLFPIANAKGAFYGAIGGFLFTSFIALPIKFYHIDKRFAYPTKPLSVEECHFNQTIDFDLVSDNSTANHSPQERAERPPFIFRISHFYQTFFGGVFTIILGLIVSWATKDGDHDQAPPRILLSPVCRRFARNEAPDGRELQELLQGSQVVLAKTEKSEPKEKLNI